VKFSGVAFFAAVLSAPFPADAEELDISELEHGIFQAPRQEIAPGERLIAAGSQPVIKTTSIPARLGLRFGLRYRLTDDSYADKPVVKLLYLTPGINDPDSGKRLDKIELVQELSADSNYHLMAFEFTDPAELTTGEWRFFVFAEDRKLAEQAFNVVAE
jgi:hypothetical protein